MAHEAVFFRHWASLWNLFFSLGISNPRDVNRLANRMYHRIHKEEDENNPSRQLDCRGREEAYTPEG